MSLKTLAEELSATPQTNKSVGYIYEESGIPRTVYINDGASDISSLTATASQVASSALNQPKWEGRRRSARNAASANPISGAVAKPISSPVVASKALSLPAKIPAIANQYTKAIDKIKTMSLKNIFDDEVVPKKKYKGGGFVDDVKTFVKNKQPELYRDKLFVGLNALTEPNLQVFGNSDKKTDTVSKRMCKALLEYITIDITMMQNFRSMDLDINAINLAIFNQLNGKQDKLSKLCTTFGAKLGERKLCHINDLIAYMRFIILDVLPDPLTESDDPSNQIMRAYITRYQEILNEKHDNYIKQLKIISDGAKDEYNTSLKKIQKLIQEQDNNKFLSYLKIANHVGNDATAILKHNPRFRIRYDNKENRYDDKEKPTFLQLSYDIRPDSFYTEDNPNTTSTSGDFRNKNNFIFGKFNRILPPFSRSIKDGKTVVNVTTNTDDAKSIKKDILDKLTSGIPVCIVGYGRSGSGKTTSLIKSNTESDKSSGILIQLVEALASTKNYANIDVRCIEFANGLKPRTDELNINLKGNTVKGLDVFLMNNILGISQSKDGKRKVMATTNNKVSSRSHVMIHIKLTGKNQTPNVHLYGGDLAGVENKFLDDTKTRSDFLTIKQESDSNYFYKTNVENKYLKNYMKAMTTEDYSTRAKLDLPVEDIEPIQKLVTNIDMFKAIRDTTLREGIVEGKYPSASLIELLIGEPNTVFLKSIMNCIITGVGSDNDKKREANTIRQRDLQFIQTFVPLSHRDGTITINGKDIVTIRNTDKSISEDEATTFRESIKTHLTVKINTLKAATSTQTESTLTEVFTAANVITNQYEEYIVAYYGKTIVDARTAEGLYINNEISNFRDNVRSILNKRNSECLYYAPAIDPDCMDSYCPNFNECFTSKDDDKKPPKSAIMDWMKNQYITQNQDTTPVFEADCILGVFCVLNITGNLSNDPPSVPYVNINKFSQLWEEIEAYGFLDIKRMKIVDLKKLKLRSQTLGALITNLNGESHSGEKDQKTWMQRYADVTGELGYMDDVAKTKFKIKFNELLTVDQYLNRTKNKATELLGLETEVKAQKSKLSKLVETNGKIPEKLKNIKTLLTSDITAFLKSFESNPSIKSIIYSSEYTAVMQMFENVEDLTDLYYGEVLMTSIVVPFMNYINKHNASSDIGTIEFLDNFAKSNTVNRVCTIDAVNEKTTAKYMNVYSDQMDSVPPVEEESGKTKKQITKKKTKKKTKK